VLKNARNKMEQLEEAKDLGESVWGGRRYPEGEEDVKRLPMFWMGEKGVRAEGRSQYPDKVVSKLPRVRGGKTIRANRNRRITAKRPRRHNPPKTNKHNGKKIKKKEKNRGGRLSRTPRQPKARGGLIAWLPD